MNLAEAATLPLAYCTAYYGLIIRANLCEGQSVLIHSGAGAVGSAAIRIALNRGMYTVSLEFRSFGLAGHLALI